MEERERERRRFGYWAGGATGHPSVRETTVRD
jgi:hypothetical protein